MRLDALQTVVAAGTALRAQAEAADRQSDFIDHHKQIGGWIPRFAAQIRMQRFAAQVHVRRRLHEADARAADRARRDARLAVLPPRLETPNVGEVVDNPPADVVSRLRVLRTRISQTENDFHRTRRIRGSETEKTSQEAGHA